MFDIFLYQDHTSLDNTLVGFFFFFNYRKIVDRIDSDGDGFVTTEELKTWIKRVQKRYIYDNVAKVWKDYDRDKDDKISWEEYKQATYGYYLGKRCHKSDYTAGAPITSFSGETLHSIILSTPSGGCHSLLSRSCLCNILLCLLEYTELLTLSKVVGGG